MINKGAPLWYTEYLGDSLSFSYKVKELILSESSKFQQIDIIDTFAFGKALFLDKVIQSAEIDEYIYHEMLVHPAMFAFDSPKSVLIIGGGEGATLREVLRHDSVEHVVMVDIDGELVEYCEKYMPEWSNGAFKDSRAELIFDDARKYVFETDKKFDVIISDLTEPLEEGPSIYLYTKEYYSKIYDILNEKGVFVAQSGSGDIFYSDLPATVVSTLKTVFGNVDLYTAFMVSFASLWTYSIALKNSDLSFEKISENIKKSEINLKYLYPELLSASTVYPKYLKESIENNRIISTDENPYFWENG